MKGLKTPRATMMAVAVMSVAVDRVMKCVIRKSTHEVEEGQRNQPLDVKDQRSCRTSHWSIHPPTPPVIHPAEHPSLRIVRVKQQVVPVPDHLALGALRSSRAVSLLRMLPQTVCGFAVLGLGRVRDELGLSRLTEHQAMLGKRRCDRCGRVGLFGGCRGFWGVATELDGASALDGDIVVVVGECVGVIVGRCAGTGVSGSIAVQATKEMSSVDSRGGGGAERSVGRSIDSLAAGTG